MAKKQNKKRFPKPIIKPLNDYCPFCKGKTEPDYKDYPVLERYMNDRAKIMGKDRSGICSKHQRKFSVAVKRARHLALLPFIPTLH